MGSFRVFALLDLLRSRNENGRVGLGPVPGFHARHSCAPDLETPSGRKKAVLSAPEPSPVGTGRRKDLNLANPAEGRFFSSKLVHTPYKVVRRPELHRKHAAQRGCAIKAQRLSGREGWVSREYYEPCVFFNAWNVLTDRPFRHSQLNKLHTVLHLHRPWPEPAYTRGGPD